MATERSNKQLRRQSLEQQRDGFRKIAAVIASDDEGDDGEGASDFRPAAIAGISDYFGNTGGGVAGPAHPIFKNAAGMDGDTKLNANVQDNAQASENLRSEKEEQLQPTHTYVPKSGAPKPRPS